MTSNADNMLNREDLGNMLGRMENGNLEKTAGMGKPDKFGEAICAFSNDLGQSGQPGYLLIGVHDDGSLAGLKAEERNLQTLLAFRNDGRIVPPPSLSVELFSFEGGDVIVLEVQPSRLPPVRFQGRVWVRNGPRRDVATVEEERRLSEKRSHFARTFDAQPCFGSSVEDLSEPQFRLSYLPSAIDADTLAANHRELRQQLASLKFYDLRADCPSYAGILLFGINPRLFLAGAYVQYVRFEGSDENASISAELRFEGDLVAQLASLKQFIRTQLVRTRQSAIGEPYVHDYPASALEELVYNAMIHRDYEFNAGIKVYEFSDRIEISNPGGLYGGVTAENFPDVNDYRNPILAEAAKNLGYVNTFNIGVKRAREALARNGNPAPRFILDVKNHFSVIVFKRL